MKMDEIIDTIRGLSYYNLDFYWRLYKKIIKLKENDAGAYEILKNKLESQNFKNDLDIIHYFENLKLATWLAFAD